MSTYKAIIWVIYFSSGIIGLVGMLKADQVVPHRSVGWIKSNKTLPTVMCWIIAITGGVGTFLCGLFAWHEYFKFRKKSS